MQDTRLEIAHCFVAAKKPLNVANCLLSRYHVSTKMAVDKTTRLTGMLFDWLPREIYSVSLLKQLSQSPHYLLAHEKDICTQTVLGSLLSEISMHDLYQCN